MRKILIIFGAILLSCCLAKRTFAQKPLKPKPFSVTIGFGRTAAITDWDVSRREFSLTTTLNYRISKRFSASASVVKTMTAAPFIIRFGVSYRLISF